MSRSLKAVELERELSSTRYHLVVTVDPQGGLLVAWPEAQWSAWASDRVGGELRPWVKSTRRSGPSAVDIENIRIVLDEAREALAR